MGKHRQEGTEAVSFKTFLCWMKELRQLGIEGFSSIYRPTELTMEERPAKRVEKKIKEPNLLK